MCNIKRNLSKAGRLVAFVRAPLGVERAPATYRGATDRRIQSATRREASCSQKFRFRHPNPAIVIALTALFVALGGSSYAAVKLSKNSVRSTHIKNGQIKRNDLARSAIDTTKIKDRSLLSTDFKPGQLAAGPQGPPGPRGPKGDRGAPGTNGTRGPSNALTAGGGAATNLADASDTVLHSLRLPPAASLVIHAKVALDNQAGAATVDCRIYPFGFPTNSFDKASVDLAADVGPDQDTIALTAAITTTGGSTTSLIFGCDDNGATVAATDTQLNAIQVQTLNGN